MTLPFFGLHGPGASGSGVFLQDHTLSDIVVSPTNAATSLTLYDTGVLRTVQGATTVDETDEWLIPNDTPTAAGFEYQMTVNTGSFTSGTTGSWVTGTQTWTRNRGAPGIDTVTATLQIRNKTSLVVVATCAISMTAEVD